MMGDSADSRESAKRSEASLGHPERSATDIIPQRPRASRPGWAGPGCAGLCAGPLECRGRTRKAGSPRAQVEGVEDLRVELIESGPVIVLILGDVLEVVRQKHIGDVVAVVLVMGEAVEPEDGSKRGDVRIGYVYDMYLV